MSRVEWITGYPFAESWSHRDSSHTGLSEVYHRFLVQDHY